MMALRGSTIVGILVLVWVVWIVLAHSSQQRIERGCQPVVWAGNVTTSLTALTLPKYQNSVEGAFDRMDYGCRYTAWRLLHEQDWIKHQEREGLSQQYRENFSGH